MSAIDGATMRVVASLVSSLAVHRPDAEIHTVTVTLNGGHGGVDVTADAMLTDGSPWQATFMVGGSSSQLDNPFTTTEGGDD